MRMVDYSSMSTSTAAPVLRNDDGSSHAMPKARPKIKIIHIIAPEIIKTDVANFRDLVQRLTGKQTAAEAATATSAAADELPPSLKQQQEEETMMMIKKRPAPVPVQPENDINKKKKIKCEVKVEEGGFGYEFDHHNELWMDLNPGGFLSFLEEDVFGGMAADLLQPLGPSIEEGFCW